MQLRLDFDGGVTLFTGAADIGPVSAALKQAGFAVNAAEPEAATVIVGDGPPEHLALSTRH